MCRPFGASRARENLCPDPIVGCNHSRPAIFPPDGRPARGGAGVGSAGRADDNRSGRECHTTAQALHIVARSMSRPESLRARLQRTPPGYHYPIGRVLTIYGGLMIVVLLIALDQTIVATALPHIVGDLGGL